MSDFITNLARRVEPNVEVRPRIKARFESEQRVSDTHFEAPIQPQTAATTEPESVDRQWNRQLDATPIEVGDQTPTNDVLVQIQRETPNVEVKSSSPRHPAPWSDPKQLLDYEPDARQELASKRQAQGPDITPSLDQRIQDLRELVADVERRLNLRPAAMPSMDTVTQTPDLRPTVDGPTTEIANNTIIEQYVNPDIGRSLTESITRPANTAATQSATPSRQGRTVRSPIVPSVQPEKTAAVRAAEAVADQRTVNIKIGRVEVKAIASSKTAEVSSAPRQQTGSMVMSLDDYVARRTAGGIG